MISCTKAYRISSSREADGLRTKVVCRVRRSTIRCHSQVDSSSSPKPVVVCLGDPVLDLIYCVEDDQLDALRVTRGGSLVVSPAEAEKLKSQLHADPVPVVGGSAANVARALASIFSYFPGAPTVRFAGMLGSDATGAIFDEIMRAAGVESSLAVDALFPTAHCICLVSSDGQRTMRTCLGAAAQLSGIEALPGGWLSEASLVHVEGYALHRPELLKQALRSARQSGAITSMDLASFEVVDRCADALTDILAEGLVDIVFANEEEASALSALRSRSHVLSDMTTSLAAATEPGDGATERETAACVAGDAVERERAVFGAGDNSRSSSHAKAQCSGVRRLRSRAAPVAVRALSSGCDAETLESPVERVACAAGYGVPLGSVGAEEEPYEGSEVRTMMEHILGGYGERGGAAVCVVSLGGRGCVAMRQDGTRAVSPACKVPVVDTVGAGDAFCAGFLAAMLMGRGLQECAVLGCALGAAAVQERGACISEEACEELRSWVHSVGPTAISTGQN